MPRSRRIKPVVTNTGIAIKESYCRKCMTMKKASEFHDAVDGGFIDSNGKMSICKSCSNELFDLLLASEHSYEKATLRMCRALNIKYSEDAIQAALKQIETYKEKGTENSSFFGLYKSKLRATNKTSQRIGGESINLTYEEVTEINMTSINPLQDDEFEEARDIKLFWGTDDKEDLEFLENELANFKQTHRADTYAEVVLLREVCFKLLEIHKSRQTKTSTDSSLKQLMDVMKSLAISPNQANAASAGKGADCFGVWLKEISEMRPEEWYEDKSIYKDVDNLEDYNERIFISAMRSFTTGNREFTIEGGEIVDDDMEGE